MRIWKSSIPILRDVYIVRCSRALIKARVKKPFGRMCGNEFLQSLAKKMATAAPVAAITNRPNCCQDTETAK
jgi:hypothetical protein